VVEHDEADGDEERSPVLIERQDPDHHEEEVEVGLNEAAGEVHDYGRGHHQAEGGHGRGEPPAPTVGAGQAGDLSIVAEGIEHEPQACQLDSLHCEYGQGFHLGRPMPADALDALIDAAAAREGTVITRA